jgi:hypothetical protein
MRLAGEARRVFARVVQNTCGGYSLNPKRGLLKRLFQHSELNRVDEEEVDLIEVLSVIEAKKPKKIEPHRSRIALQ